jgi:hypothetical protein
MIQKKQLVQFTVQNRTDCGIDVPIYKINVFSINATTKYTWDVTTETITCGYGTIVVDGVTISLSWDGTILGLLTALNALNYGFFCSETVGANTYIVTYDDTNIYGTLDLCFALTTTTTTTTTAAPTTTTTTTTTTAAPTTTTTTTTSTTTAAPTTTTTTTTTTLSYVTFTLAYSTISGAQACSDYPTLNTTQYYATAGSTLTTGTIIFTDIALTTPAPNGFYSNGVNYWNTGAGSGNLQNQVSCNPTTTTTTTTTTAAPTTTTTTTTTTAAPTTTTTTTTTTASALRTFRINNTNTLSSITLDVQVNSVQVITPTLIPANSVITLTPQVNCAGFTSVLLEYQLVAGYTPTSASFSNGSGTYTGTIAGGFITFTGVDLTANTFQDLTVNP